MKIYGDGGLKTYQRAFSAFLEGQEALAQLSEADKVGIAALDDIMLADMSHTVLRALKYKLQNYNMVTGKWRGEL